MADNPPALADPLPVDTRFLASMPQAQPLAIQAGGSTGQVAIAYDAARQASLRYPRSLARVVADLKVLAATNGENYYYSWMVKNKRTGKEEEIYGPTIKLANDLARIYGNCLVSLLPIDETPTHWIFTAQFTDYETGFSLQRQFQQRKKQSIGMADADRGADIVFQIGQSKAARNVIVNALGAFTDMAVELSRDGMLNKVAANIDRTNRFIDKALEKFGCPVDRVEKILGKKRAAWELKDVTRVYMELRGVVDGMVSIDEVYPDSGKLVEIEETPSVVGSGDTPPSQQQATPPQDPAQQPAAGEPAAPKAPKERKKKEPAAVAPPVQQQEPAAPPAAQQQPAPAQQPQTAPAADAPLGIPPSLDRKGEGAHLAADAPAAAAPAAPTVDLFKD